MEMSGSVPPDDALRQFKPDFAAFVRLGGGDGVRVEHVNDIGSALVRAMATKVPIIIVALVRPSGFSYPPNITWKQALGFGYSKLKDVALTFGGEPTSGRI